MRSILLSHPHAKADAQGFAAALDRAGRLGAFFTGAAAVPRSLRGAGLRWVGRLMPRVKNRLVAEVSEARLYGLFGVEMGARAVAAAARWLGAAGPKAYDCLYVSHDAAVSVWPWPRGIDGVYAYEDGALRTFRRAARSGLGCWYDLPTPHYAAVERVWRTESARWPEAVGGRPPVEPPWKKRRKDGELAAASGVCVASRFTRESLEAIDYRGPCHVIPYGFPVESFAAKDRPPDGPFTVLAVGAQNLRKGTPYLLEAWKQAGLRDARLRLVGPMQLDRRFLDRYRDGFQHVPHLDKVELAREYRAADVLVFASLADGFGLVVQEAMACGTAVIATRCGGGPECIDSGRNGWLVPERSVEALADHLRLAAGDRQAVFHMGRAARRRAEQYTWKDAGQVLVNLLATL